MSANLDFSVVNFASYSEYLSSYTKNVDYRYLSDMPTVKRFIKLGYRSAAKVYEEAEFDKMKSQVAAHLNPKTSIENLYGRHFKGTDAALKALMEREELNLLQKLSTIIFLQVRQKSGFDISGYIDYFQSLRDCFLQKPDRVNWKAIFEGKKLLRPKPSDLSYYDWHKGFVSHNNTETFHAVSGGHSLIFMHKTDHKLIPVTDKPSRFAKNVNRIMIQSELYGYMILYDHVVR